MEKPAGGENQDQNQRLLESWPQLVGQNLKNKIVNMFRQQTSTDTLSTFTCSSCGEATLRSSQQKMPINDVKLDLLKIPLTARLASVLPYQNGPLQNVLLDPAGVTTTEAGEILLLLCKLCHSSLQRNKLPSLSIANQNFLGPVPPELRDLTVIEEAMIARCRAKCWIVQLKEENLSIVMPDVQRGMKGHIIIYPQRPSQIARLLPPDMSDILTPICVLFVGSSPPSQDWLREKAKPLSVRREKVRGALIWIKENNPLYSDVEINHELLNSLEESQILPFHIEHIIPNEAVDILTSRYDDVDQSGDHNENLNCEQESPVELPFQNVVITDVDGHAPANELRAAALRHVKGGGGYIQIPHDPTPVNEFFNPDLFPMIYPTLFPYGVGGFEDKQRKVPLSMKRQVKHLCSLSDKRFQEHYSFLFTAFNILQRRAVLLHTSLKTRKSTFPTLADDFASVSREAIHIVTERISRGDAITANNIEERKVLNLMKQVNTVTSNVPGTSASRISMRNEIRGLMIEKGFPSFFVTINPADVYNPLVKFLGGAEIDIDNLLPVEVPNYTEQSILIAKNPFIAAKFFNIYMKVFISALLKFDPKQKDLEGGILGVVKAYYGCVEAQGRGTLHCHMMVWLQGGLNPDEIKKNIIDNGDLEFRDRLIAFLNDTILNEIPADPDPNLIVPSSIHHPCSVRGNIQSTSGIDKEQARKKDIYHLAKKCQIHKHSKTCYKYWKGPPQPKECRFDLDPSNVQLETTFDMETGEICMRCLDGLVNNFNETILEAIRCNMDIKFIGSGSAAKAIIYYITNYITKSQLKTHVAYSALELSVKKLGEYNAGEDDLTVRAKKLLQKCAYSMISHQELSAQQVASYLMDYEDHFTSHEYRNLFWTSFESFINKEDPSPECYEKNLNKFNGADQENSDNTGLPVDIENGVDYENTGHDSESDNLTNLNDYLEDKEPFEDEDVTISTHTVGNLFAKANQVADYQLRGQELDNWCVWDFISQTEKKRIRKTCTGTGKRKDSGLNEKFDNGEIDDKLELESDNGDSDEEYDDEDHDTAVSSNIATEIPTRNRRRQRKTIVHFLSEHIEALTHWSSIRSLDKIFIPMPIGPSLPRRDKIEVRARYCRLMLILFRPWRHANDLRFLGQSWEAAFSEFLEECSPKIKNMMNNMQLLHECHDSGRDHFADRRNKSRSSRNQCPQEIINASSHKESDDFGPVNPDILLDHLQSISNCNSQRIARSKETVDDCLLSAEKSGMFDMVENINVLNTDSIDDAGKESYETYFVQKINDCDLHLEEQWKTEYELRRDQWKRKASTTDVSITSSNIDETSFIAVNDGSELRIALQKQTAINPSILLQNISQGPGSTVNDSDPVLEMIDAMIEEYTLNTEQARAFRIICEHSLKKNSSPLRMYIGGAGGTGKSRVINALKEFFIRRGQSRRFRLASYTGVAAKNISGMTVHSALSINQRNKSGSQLKTHRDLVAMWEGVDYFFIDEISMIGCAMLYKISEALIDSKGISTQFGGINLIVAGDFAQLPPVGETQLYANVDTSKTSSASTRGQETVFGKLLWLSINKVVILTQSMRQCGPENERLVQLLGRLREGRCTDDDFDLLSTRILDNISVNWSEWQNVPIIVSENAQKDALNERAAQAFANRTNQTLHWYYAEDSHRGNTITDPELKGHLETLNSGITNQRLGKIPLVPGMPIMITQNYDVEGGIVNGCTGILKKIRYKEDSLGNRYATSCVIESNAITAEKMPSLTLGQAVVLQETVDITFKHPHSGKQCKIKRTQLPITPGFAMTAHKAQGQTMKKVIIDIESVRGTEAPYVMVSHVTSLDGLLILRHFRREKIKCRQSEDLRTECQRLENLRLDTISEFGSPQEIAALVAASGRNSNNSHSNQIQNDTSSSDSLHAKKKRPLQVVLTNDLVNTDLEERKRKSRRLHR